MVHLHSRCTSSSASSCVQAGILYFTQKLANYSLADNKVVCNVWHKSEGGLDANCFASCLTDFITTEINDEDKNKIKIFYSDGWCSQNRVAQCSPTLISIKNFTILQKYLVKGHTQMECDIINSTKEIAKKYMHLLIMYKSSGKKK